jgi:acetyl esterase/lipase
MHTKTIDIRTAYTMEPAKLDLYLLDLPEKFASRERPLVLICPGGAYARTSVREAEPVALAFCAMGYHAAVLHYSCAPAVFPAALAELAQSVALVRSHAPRWHVLPDEICVLGFSAGGHLAACLGAYWEAKFLQDAAELPAKLMRPNRLILGYPVITAGAHCHEESIENLLGGKADDPAARDLVSIERHVGAGFPKTFLWATSDDGSVPVQNSLLLATALADAGIPCEAHLFDHGAHGLALGDWRTESAEKRETAPRVSSWLALAGSWMEAGRKGLAN